MYVHYISFEELNLLFWKVQHVETADLSRKLLKIYIQRNIADKGLKSRARAFINL